MHRILIITVFFLLNLLRMEAQHISEVLEYVPAPGQFTNTMPWGTPVSASSIVGAVNGSLCLGAFGGYVVFRFEDPVENHPDNPFGVDFTIFGNPMPHWSEPGVVWVMEDRNENGLPDESWYELAGSDFYFTTTIRQYEVTYRNPGGTVARDVPWSDQFGNSGILKTNSLHTQSYYPSPDSFPFVPQDRYTLSGTLIRGAVDTGHPPLLNSARRAFGYADNQIRGETKLLLPDNPYTVAVENSGGDAFDIGWAVDSNADYVELSQVHFIKVQNGLQADGAWLGELSTEVTGAVDVAPDETISGEIDLIVIRDLPAELSFPEYQLEVYVFHQGRIVLNPKVDWTSSTANAEVDENNMLRVSESGKVTLTAFLTGQPQIHTTVSTTVHLAQTSNGGGVTEVKIVRLHPNPSSDNVQVSGIREATLSIYNANGKRVRVIENYCGGLIPISSMASGIYLVKVEQEPSMDWLKLIKD